MTTKRHPKPTNDLVNLDAIRIDGDTQSRVTIDLDRVEVYAEAYRADATMPPLVVFFDGRDYWLADGFHRWHAAKKIDWVKIEVEVHQGTVEDARWFSCGANKTHGLNRTNADKAKAVQSALKNPTGAKLSNEQIAEHVGVSASTVAKYRGQLTSSGEIPAVSDRTGRDGRTINVDGIGKRPVRPAGDDPDRLRLGRCKTPGVGDCDCDACQELAELPEEQRPTAYREACERFETRHPKPIEIRMVVREWGEETTDDEPPEESFDDEPAEAEDAGEENEPEAAPAIPRRSVEDELRDAVRQVLAGHRGLSAVTIRAMLIDLADEAEQW